MSRAETMRNVILAVLGVAALVLKPLYSGPFSAGALCYGGNFAVSFALYFVALTAVSRYGFGMLTAAACTILAVESFEATNGFGVMANVYDPIDFVANAAGVGFAVAVDLSTRRVLRRRES